MLTRVPSDAWLVAVHIRAGDRGMLAERKANRERPVTASKGTSSDVRSTGAHLDHLLDVLSADVRRVVAALNRTGAPVRVFVAADSRRAVRALKVRQQ